MWYTEYKDFLNDVLPLNILCNRWIPVTVAYQLKLIIVISIYFENFISSALRSIIIVVWKPARSVHVLESSSAQRRRVEK